MKLKHKLAIVGVITTLGFLTVCLLQRSLPRAEAFDVQAAGLTVTGPTPKPESDYNRPPKMRFDAADFAFHFDQLEETFRVPGEYTHRLEGATYGFDSLSFIITDTQPNGGPNLHVHEVEEAHVLLDGTARYQMGEKTFTVEAPYIVKVPAGVPHTFINAGKKPFRLMAVFASKHLASKRLGPNPLLQTEKKQ